MVTLLFLPQPLQPKQQKHEKTANGLIKTPILLSCELAYIVELTKFVSLGRFIVDQRE